MNKLWIRLSLAFFSITTLTVVTIFSLVFVASWLGDERLTPAEFADEYEQLAAPFVETMIIQGESDQEIITLLATEPRLQVLIQQKRSDGFASGVDVEDRSLGRILGDYLFELVDPINAQIIFIGTIIGMIASVFVSRQLTRPLAELTQASHALGLNDLTQRVNIEGTEEINNLTTTFNDMAVKLEQAEQIRQNMLADVSHELRTPLAGLEGILRASLDGVFTLDTHQVSNLYEQTRHLTRLVDDLHLLARAEAQRLPLDRTDIDVTALLTDLANTFDILAQDAAVVLQCQLQPVVPIYGDAVRIRQMVSNLLNNALHHTSSGGTITLSLHQGETNIAIVVRDTGAGIAEDHLSHLFDRFYRADASRSRDTGGTGLGLAITKALVEAHGGRISADSPGIGQGSIFKILLPLPPSK